MFLFHTETKRVVGGALRRQEYEEYPEKTSRVFQERRQKAIKVCREFGSEQSSNIGTSVCRAIALSSLRDDVLRAVRTSLFLSDQGANNGDVHGASEFTSHRRSVAETRTGLWLASARS